MRKKYYQKLAFMGMLLIVLLAFQNYTGREKDSFPEVKFITTRSTSWNLTDFNPNDLDAMQWEHLGFSEKQVSTILNYKKMVGGQFRSKDQLKKCYAISAEKFSELESYIMLPEAGKDHHFEKFDKYEKKEIRISRKIQSG
ncbi:Helix-hairpin-helix motif [Chryseobacterium carnipullorum]|uniref:Helix-hairpin-helix motif n=2 Tax=Chryseobacterium carnipullorum TaxID=1124835 RepID=A0A376E6B5_CHRCU|nr:Helix-hairpin-helix motif [Chryseobacterium carnipullorum]